MPAPSAILDALDRQVRRRLPLWRRLTPAQLFVGGFLLLVALGTALLLLLPGLYTGERLSFVDALFTATSAVCVTGLIVVDTATYFTPFGQGVILFLIQIGGLGILSFTTLIVLLLGGRLSLRTEAAVGPAELVPEIDTAALLRGVFVFTLAIEAIGAVLFWAAWAGELGVVGAIWPAVFHAISAFCNAGFSIFTANLARFGGDVPTLVIAALLLVAGGLGFLVMEEVWLALRGRKRRRLSLHSRIVLAATAALLALGWALFLVFEWGNVLAEFTPAVRPAAALFMSATPRTAGFNNVDYALLSPAGAFLTMILMTIGGSPASTAGGLKTTTAAILVAVAVARIRGRVGVDVFRRTLPEGTIQRATGLVVVVIAILAAAILVLQLTELRGVPHSLSRGLFLELAFEVVSAFSTVGLSMGVTGGLTTGGKLLITVLMFAGRVGPFMLVASMARAARAAPVHLRYASEDVVVG